jgi:hypothetical protein
MNQPASLIVSSTPSLKNIAQISSHSFWQNQLIFTVLRFPTLHIIYICGHMFLRLEPF